MRIDEMIPLGIRMTTSYNNKSCQLNREFQDMFFLKLDKKLDDLDFLTEELDGLVAFEAGEGIKLFSGEKDEIEGDAYLVREVNGREIKIREKILIKKEDIIKVKDNYYYKIFIMAELYLNGWKYISIQHYE